MKSKYVLGTFLIGVGIGILIGVIMQLYWIYLVVAFILCGLFLIK